MTPLVALALASASAWFVIGVPVAAFTVLVVSLLAPQDPPP